MKGIIMAGGTGSRLYPCTKVVSKQLIPVYDKPMIYYPLSVLMLAGIREVLIITTPHDSPLFQELLGNGSHLGMSFSYKEQPKPEGLAQAFVLGYEFLEGQPCCMILGDNIFYGNGLTEIVRQGAETLNGGVVFGYQVKNPGRYGVIEFDLNGKAISIKEKPKYPKSNYAVPGIYFYGPQVCREALKLKPSSRGEYEITDLNNLFLKKRQLKIIKMGRGIAWLDTGSHQSLLEASNFVQTVQDRQGLMVACLEEIAFNLGWITKKHLHSQIKRKDQNPYQQYLLNLLK